jgi:hypothetical protein
VASKFIIYALSEPDGDQAVRYVGRSSNGLDRPRAHTTPSVLSRGKTHTANWLRSLRDRGLKPLIEVIEDFADPTALPEAEQYWIAQMRAWGFSLTNHTIGGEGSIGFKMPSQIKEHLASIKGGLPPDSKREICRLYTEEKLTVRAIAPRFGIKHIRVLKILKAAGITLRSRAEAHRHSLPFMDENGVVYNSQKEACKLLGVHRTALCGALHGRQKTAGGHTFKWIVDDK